MHIRIILFVILANAFNYAQSLSQLQIVDKPTLLVSEMISKDVKDSNGEVCAGLIIMTDMEGLRYDSYNKIVRINSLPGKDLLFLSPSEEIVTVYKSGYSPLQIILRDQGIKLESGKVWQIKITGDIKKELIPINILTTPSNDGIFIDNELKGSGTTHKVTLGKHAIRIVKKGYNTINDTINVTPEKILFSYNLEINKPVIVTIRSVPDGASIQLNGLDKGKTPKQTFELVGKYKLKLKKNGYNDFETEIEIKSTGKNDFTFNLVKNMATIFVELDPADAEIYFDGDLKTGKVFDAKSGTHYLEIKKENFITLNDTLYVNVGDTIRKQYTLQSNTSQINLTITPADAVLEINQQVYTKTNDIELPVGTYLIEVKSDGYESHMETVNLERNQRFSKKISLTPIVGSLQLSVSPIESKVRLLKDGKLISSWSGTKIVDSLVIGKYSVEAEAKGYQKEVKEITIEKNLTAPLEIALKPGKDMADVRINSISSVEKFLKNLRFEKSEAAYVVQYDLDGDLTDEYKVELFLMDKANPDFEKKLNFVTGDVGEGKFGGREKKITWRFLEEFKGGVINDNLYLKLTSEKLGGGIPWYVWAGGAVVGGVVAILVGGGGSAAAAGGSTTSIPTPPLPPGN